MSTKDHSELLRGTLDGLILRTLLLASVHGHAMARFVQPWEQEGKS